MAPLRVAEIWAGMTAPLRGRISLLFAVAAPFTLLVDMGLRIFGPSPPASADDMNARVLLWLVMLPALIGSVAQLAVAHLLLRPEQPPRVALAAAFAVWPLYVATLLISAIPSGLALLLLVLPGIYVTSRLFLIVPLVIEARGQTPIELLRRSWALTAPASWTIFGFLLLAILALFGISLVAGGVGGAIGAVLTLFGLAALGKFAAGLVPAIAATFVAIGSAALASYLYQRLRD